MINSTEKKYSLVKESEKSSLRDNMLERYKEDGYATSILAKPLVEDCVSDVLRRKRGIEYIEAIKKGDEMTDLDRKIIEMTINDIQEQIEEQIVENESVDEQQIEYTDKFITSISKCFITGCEVHTLFGGFIHYGRNVNSYDLRPISEMPERMKIGYDAFCQNPDCLSVEVYEHHICVIAKDGRSFVLNI